MGLNFPASALDLSPLVNNAWLACFSFGDGSLQIKLRLRRTLRNAPVRTQLMLQFSCEPSCEQLLNHVQVRFGGSVYPRKNNASVNYSSGGFDFDAASKIVNYFDRYTCFRQRGLYVLFRQAYMLVYFRTNNI